MSEITDIIILDFSKVILHSQKIYYYRNLHYLGIYLTYMQNLKLKIFIKSKTELKPINKYLKLIRSNNVLDKNLHKLYLVLPTYKVPKGNKVPTYLKQTCRLS